MIRKKKTKEIFDEQNKGIGSEVSRKIMGEEVVHQDTQRGAEINIFRVSLQTI